jgi:hypothetical protein
LKLFDQVYDQKIQLKNLRSPLHIQNTDLDSQWRVRDTQLTALIAESNSLSKQKNLFNIQVNHNISTQNTDFSAVRNDIAAWKIAFAALETKMFDFQPDMDHAQAIIASAYKIPNYRRSESK